MNPCLPNRIASSPQQVSTVIVHSNQFAFVDQTTPLSLIKINRVFKDLVLVVHKPACFSLAARITKQTPLNGIPALLELIRGKNGGSFAGIHIRILGGASRDQKTFFNHLVEQLQGLYYERDRFDRFYPCIEVSWKNGVVLNK